MSENQIADRARFIQAYEASVITANADVRMLPSVKTVSQKYQLGRAGDVIKKLADGVNHD